MLNNDTTKTTYRRINEKIKFLQAFKWLDDIALLKDDWNGYGAHPFSSDHISHVRNILTYFSGKDMECPIVSPTARDSIQIEWHVPDGCLREEEKYLEIEVYADGHIELFMNLNSVPAIDVIELYHTWIDES